LTGGRGTTGAGDGGCVAVSCSSSDSEGALDVDAGADDGADALVGLSVVEAGAPGVELSGADGAGWLPTETAPLTEPVTGANPLRSGSSAARLQLTFREPAFQESSVMLSQ
jgi:hypothetical protein